MLMLMQLACYERKTCSRFKIWTTFI